MGPDPFTMPSFGSQSAAQNSAALGKAINQAAPLAPQWHGIQQGPAPDQVFTQPAAPKSGGVLSNFAHFIGGVGTDIGHIAGGAAHWLGQQLYSAAQQPVHLVQGIDHAFQDNKDINQNQAWTQQVSDKMIALTRGYRGGVISSQAYHDGIKQISDMQTQITEGQLSLQNRIKADKNATMSGLIGTGVDVITIMTAGLGKVAMAGAEALPVGERAAATFLASHAPDQFLTSVEQGINKLATTPQLFEKLAPTAQKAIQAATAEVVGTSTSMTAQQIARTAAVNLAFKYPIYFNMMNPQAQQIYSKLDDRKYGAAFQQSVVNAALVLSGGPVGWALKQGGKAFSAASLGLFGQSSFIDELSKGIGDGNVSGIYNEINKLDNPKDYYFFKDGIVTNKIAKDELKGRVVQNMSNLEATNMTKVTGKDPTAAAWRVLNGMASYEGLGMDNFTHSEFLLNGNNYSTAAQFTDYVAQKYGLGAVVPARLDVRMLKTAAETVSPAIASGKKAFSDAVDSYIAANKNQPWANNDNFIKQLKGLGNKYSDPQELASAIKDIKATTAYKDFPAKEGKILAKMGYIPVKPANLEAPFKEGSGTLLTHSAEENGDFFLKAVKPLPVLESAGNLLTSMGLSPQSSISRVYEIFNSNLADNMTNLQFIDRAVEKGSSNSEKADILIKKLSNYAHDRTTFAQRAAPITDLRQMTTGDIMRALPLVTKADAKEIKGAIMDSMLQVPLSIRGLGDKLVDVSYKIPPQKAFLRIQGGARFAWNPFFQAKLAYKTEILTQAEAGGHFPTALGTNTILSTVFADKYNQLDAVRTTLRKGGIFDETAHFGEGLTGEAVNDYGPAGSNLTHKLLPTQERSIAALVSVQADKLNMSVEDFVKYNTQHVMDTVQMIAQYDRQSVFLNSAMARTLNLAFFPFRFEYKVASIMARSLGRSSMLTQLSVINGLYRADSWLNSPEGQAWYSTNAQAIGLIRYFTPVQTLGEVASLLGGHPDAIGQFGELGGLPFGWIPQLLDTAGLTNFGGVYVSPTTGQTIPKYVPQTDKGNLLIAIQDLIGSLYTYPGTQAGLPSKTSIDRNIAVGLTGANKKTDLRLESQPIPPKEVNFSQAVQQASAQRAQQQGQPQVPKNQTNLPQQPTEVRPLTNVPIGPPNLPPGKSSSAKGKSTKLKKSQFKPELLPGQTTLGQL